MSQSHRIEVGRGVSGAVFSVGERSFGWFGLWAFNFQDLLHSQEPEIYKTLEERKNKKLKRSPLTLQCPLLQWFSSGQTLNQTPFEKKVFYGKALFSSTAKCVALSRRLFSPLLSTQYIFFLYSHVLCNLLFMSTIHHTRPCVTSFLCPEIDVAGFYLTNWCTRRTWEEKVLMQQQQWSRGILLITRSANLIFQLRLGQRGSREVVVAEWGGLTGGEGGLGDTGKTKKGRVQWCAPAHFPSLSHFLQHSPRDHIGSEAEHEGADEGADLPRRSLSSPPLLLQAALANTGDTKRAAGLQSVGHTQGKPQSVFKIPWQDSKEWRFLCLLLMRTVKSGC